MFIGAYVTNDTSAWLYGKPAELVEECLNAAVSAGLFFKHIVWTNEQEGSKELDSAWDCSPAPAGTGHPSPI
jgi:hypothetical protein